MLSSAVICLAMVAGAAHPARAALSPALHTGLGGRGSAGGLRVSPQRTPGVCCAVCTRPAGFSCYFWLSGMLSLEQYLLSVTWEEAKHSSQRINSDIAQKLLQRGRRDASSLESTGSGWGEGWLLH